MTSFINKKLAINMDKFIINGEEEYNEEQSKIKSNKNLKYLEMNYKQKIIELGGSPRKTNLAKKT